MIKLWKLVKAWWQNNRTTVHEFERYHVRHMEAPDTRMTNPCDGLFWPAIDLPADK